MLPRTMANQVRVCVCVSVAEKGKMYALLAYALAQTHAQVG